MRLEDGARQLRRARGVKPHRVEPFKVSTDPEFVAKRRDVVGLYVDPPKRAVVFSVDEKSQIQALNRTQPGLPLKKGRAGTMTHDDERHGTTTRFAALDVATGRIEHACHPRHTRDEFLRFMTQIERTVPKGQGLHVILDNYATHTTPEVQAWLRRHPRVHFHFTPTSASWLNLVERFFGELTTRQLRRLAVTSVRELEQAIGDYIAQRNTAPRPSRGPPRSDGSSRRSRKRTTLWLHYTSCRLRSPLDRNCTRLHNRQSTAAS
ncbi:MAG: IS630 family transposase [Gemmatimonadaceae bacterium]